MDIDVSKDQNIIVDGAQYQVKALIEAKEFVDTIINIRTTLAYPSMAEILLGDKSLTILGIRRLSLDDRRKWADAEADSDEGISLLSDDKVTNYFG